MCHLSQPDVYFLVDMSKTVGTAGLKVIITFIREFIKEFTVSSSDAQFGFATFAASFKALLPFNKFNSKKERSS
jgi:hypothetical protein